MSQQNIKQLKAVELSAQELGLQKAQQAIDDLFMAANSDETLKEQLDAATSSESFVKVATRQGYELTVADLETLLRQNQEQAQPNADEFDDEELSEQELELVAGGGFHPNPITKSHRQCHGSSLEVARNTSSSIEAAQNRFSIAFDN